jgi:hypothetical protein
MELTKKELEIADRYISKRERQLAQWPRRRWLMLAMFSALALAGCLITSDGRRSIYDDTSTDLQVHRALGDGPPPGMEYRWAVGAMIKVSKILEFRHEEVSYALMESAIGFMWLLGGVIMVSLIILRWNTGERDALICKLLRGKLQELEQVAAPGNRPPSQTPAAPESSVRL